MKKLTIIISLLIFMGMMIPLLSGNHIENTNHIFPNQDRNQDETDIPTWVSGDTWMYEADIYSNTENGVFELESDDLKIIVKNISTIIHNELYEQIYMINISGNITGTIQSSILSGDITGEINGDASIRQADLSILHSNITTSGIIEYFFIFESEFLIQNTAEYYPRFEYFDFPIKTTEEWNISAHAYQQSVFYVEDFFPENTSDGNASMDGYAECLSVESIQVPAGTFNCFHLISESNGSIESWYAPEVKNVARMYMINENETESNTIWMNLTSYTLNDQDITISASFSSSTVNVSDPVTISGFVTKTVDGTPFMNTDVTIHIPYTNNSFVVTTDHLGFFTHTFIAPLLLDPTNTTYDIGSDGVIVSVDTGTFSGYTVLTLTVIGIAIDDIQSAPQDQYQTLDVNITCMIYSVEELSTKTVSITGPTGFTAINVSLHNAGKDKYYFNQSYPLAGNYSYYIWAQNTVGNTNKSNAYTFTIIPDLIPPSIEEVTSQPNPQWENHMVNISCIVTDNVKVNAVQVLITDPQTNQFNISMTKKNNSYYHNSSYTIVGNYSYYIWAQDTVGNTQNSTPFFFSILPQIPEITNVIVYPNPQVLDGYVNISCTVTDNYGLDAVKVHINAPNGSTLFNETMDHQAIDTYYFYRNYSINGTYSFFIWAKDTCGYTNTSLIYTFTILNQSELLVDIPIFYGWNMITIPVQTSWTSLDLIANISGCLMVSWFDPVDQTFRTSTGPGYVFPIKSGMGYFVYVTSESVFSVVGLPILNVSIPLEVGWNMIGWYQAYDTNSSNLMSTISGCLMVSWFDAVNQTYKTSTGPGYVFDITRSMGLFVYVTEASVWYGNG